MVPSTTADKMATNRVAPVVVIVTAVLPEPALTPEDMKAGLNEGPGGIIWVGTSRVLTFCKRFALCNKLVISKRFVVSTAMLSPRLHQKFRYDSRKGSTHHSTVAKTKE